MRTAGRTILLAGSEPCSANAVPNWRDDTRSEGFGRDLVRGDTADGVSGGRAGRKEKKTGTGGEMTYCPGKPQALA